MSAPKRNHKPLPPLPPLKKPNSRDFRGSLESIRNQLNLSPGEFKALRRALADSESHAAKSQKHHKEDESWLDWAIGAAKKYGPQLLKLVETTAAAL